MGPTSATITNQYHSDTRANGPPTLPRAKMSIYTTDRYHLLQSLDPTQHEPETNEKYIRGYSNRHMAMYDNYKLLRGTLVNSALDVPSNKAIRVDDKCCGLLLASYRPKDLGKKWKSEFDKKGMLRAERMPLGDPLTADFSIGAIDCQGRTVQAGEEGEYYLHWRGIHPLIGERGERAGLYRVRRGCEDFILPKGHFGFKKDEIDAAGNIVSYKVN